MRQFLSRMSRKTLVIGGIALSVVLLTGVGLAAAAALHASAPSTAQRAGASATSAPNKKPGDRLGARLVQVTAVNGPTLTVAPAGQKVKKVKKSDKITLTISSDTKITSYGQPAQLSAVQVDEYLIVQGADAQHVKHIEILGFGARGAIQTVGANSLTIQNAQSQPVMISVGSSAHILEGHLPVSLSALQPGELIEAFGAKNADGSLNAMLIHVDLVHGQVTSISGSSIDLTYGNKSAQITVTTSSTTKYYVAGEEVPASTLQVGDEIAVAGPGSQKAGVTATAIFIREPKVSGKVTAVNGSAITIQGKNGTTWTISVNANTRYVKDKQPASLADVQVGSVIEAVGLKTGDNALTAIVVHIAAPKR